MDAPGGAAAEIRDLALTASQVEKNTLAWWAAYYQEPALSWKSYGLQGRAVPTDCGNP